MKLYWFLFCGSFNEDIDIIYTCTFGQFFVLFFSEFVHCGLYSQKYYMVDDSVRTNILKLSIFNIIGYEL